MEENILFTICAKNYLGIANTLETSVIANNPSISFYTFVIDEVNKQLVLNNDKILIAKNILSISNEKWEEMSFKYTLVEFCTAIKPFCFQYLFNQYNSAKIIYLDPDIYVFNSFDSVFKELNTFHIILTPHILTIEPKYTGSFQETAFLSVGIFNLGFIALKNCSATKVMLDWWGNRLLDNCFVDNHSHTATDQKWIDMLPAFYDSNNLKISRNLGLNVAPWNYFEREIIEKNGIFTVKNRITHSDIEDLLIFVHFSNLKYYNFIKQTEVIENTSGFNDINNSVLQIYKGAIIQSDFSKFINLKYSYNYFENDKPISLLNRRLFRSFIEAGYLIPSPFKVGNNSFYKILLDKGLITTNPIDKSRQSGFLDKNVTKSFKNTINYRLVELFLILIKNILGVKKYRFFLVGLNKKIRFEEQTFLIHNRIKRSFKIRN